MLMCPISAPADAAPAAPLGSNSNEATLRNVGAIQVRQCAGHQSCRGTERLVSRAIDDRQVGTIIRHDNLGVGRIERGSDGIAAGEEQGAVNSGLVEFDPQMLRNAPESCFRVILYDFVTYNQNFRRMRSREVTPSVKEMYIPPDIRPEAPTGRVAAYIDEIIKPVRMIERPFGEGENTTSRRGPW
jgi:hypothetical protein